MEPLSAEIHRSLGSEQQKSNSSAISSRNLGRPDVAVVWTAGDAPSFGAPRCEMSFYSCLR